MAEQNIDQDQSLNNPDGESADFSGAKTEKTRPYSWPFSFISFLAVAALIMTGVVIWRTVHNLSIAGTVVLSNTGNTNSIASASLSAETEALKNKDTDGDGLSDYDELYVYHSSPYLKSTAGDGISDGEKIKKGQNPTCPTGKICNQLDLTSPGTTTTSQITPSFLRGALKYAGISQATLDQLDDQSLINIYNSLVQQENANTNVNVNGATGNTNTSSGSLNANDIRQLFIRSGADANTVNALDDTTILQLYQDSLNAQTQSSTATTNTNQ